MKRCLLVSMAILFSLVFIVSIILNITFLKVINEREIKTMTKEKFLQTYATMAGGEPLKLPIIEINTQNEAFPQDKVNYINCSFKISNTVNKQYDFEKNMATSSTDEGGVGIRLRGNMTIGGAKKPFRIKFNEKTSLMGLEKNKSWVLLADYFDGSKIRNYAGLKLAEMFDNLEWTPTPNHVVLFLNNKFQGLYLLTEQIDENKGRTDVKSNMSIEDIAFLMEINRPYYYDEWISTDVCIDAANQLFAELKYPEKKDIPDKIHEGVINHINEYIMGIWTTLKTGAPAVVMEQQRELSDLIQIESLIDYYLVNEVMSNLDAGYRSTYVYKKVGEKAKFGPVWDFDVVYEKNESLSSVALFEALLSNPVLFEKVCSRYSEIRYKIDNLIEHLYDYKEQICCVARIDSKQWMKKDVFTDDFELQRKNIIKKKDFLDGVFGLSHTEFLEIYK